MTKISATNKLTVNDINIIYCTRQSGKTHDLIKKMFLEDEIKNYNADEVILVSSSSPFGFIFRDLFDLVFDPKTEPEKIIGKPLTVLFSDSVIDIESLKIEADTSTPEQYVSIYVDDCSLDLFNTLFDIKSGNPSLQITVTMDSDLAEVVERIYL